MITVHLTSEGDSARDRDNVTTEYSRHYLVFGAATKEAALDAVFGQTPPTMADMVFSGLTFSGYRDEGIEIAANYEYRAVSYAGTPGGDPQFSWDLSSGTQHVNFAKKMIAQYPKTMPDILAIGWNGSDGEKSHVAGCDIIGGDMRESYTINVKYSQLTAGYKRTIAGCWKCVNANDFMGYQPGEMLFVGCTSNGVTDRSAKIPLTFNFLIRLNEDSVQDGTNIRIIKQGWDVLTCITREKELDKKIRPQTVGYYIHRVYDRVNFKMLGL